MISKQSAKQKQSITKNDIKWWVIEAGIGIVIGVLVAWWMSNQCTLCWYDTVKQFVLRLMGN